MKFALVCYLHDPSPSSGVFKRMVSQSSACRKAGLPIDVHALSAESLSLPDGQIFNTVIGNQTKTLEKNRREVEAVASIMQDYNVVCMRNTLFSHHYFNIFRKRGAKLITELHGKHLIERWRESLTVGTYEALFTPPCLAVNDGIIAMTEELEAYAQAFTPWKRTPSTAIPNGIDVDGVPKTGFTPFDGSELHLCMVAGMDAPWHGWDRLAAGLAAYEGPVKLTLHLVGALPGPTSEDVGSHGTIRRHGPLYGQELDELMGAMHLAVATLGLHRKGQSQACALKTRDYIARGLPFVLGYDDVDIPKNCDFCMHVPNDDSPIDFEEIIRFSKAMSADSGATSETMRGWAKKNIDWTVKMRQYDKFMRKIAEG